VKLSTASYYSPPLRRHNYDTGRQGHPEGGQLGQFAPGPRYAGDSDRPHLYTLYLSSFRRSVQIFCNGVPEIRLPQAPYILRAALLGVNYIHSQLLQRTNYRDWQEVPVLLYCGWRSFPSVSRVSQSV
jgi:hypothetical protein